MLATDTIVATDYRLGFSTLNRETEVDALPLEGTLPAWLAGTLLRNGPARFEVGTDRFRHWFDGLAMLHRFTIAGGGVSYANRFLRSPGFLEAERTGRIARSEFGTDPARSLVQTIGDRLAGRDLTSHNANVNVVPFGNEWLALTETPSPIAFDGASLETRGLVTYDDALPGQITTAHTHYDPERCATFNILVEVGRTSRYHVVRIPAGTLRRELVASIEVDKPSYVHAFSTTERYVILVEYPLVVRPLDLLIARKPFIENYRWEPGRGTRIHVVAKDGGALVATHETDAFFAFHHVNAYEERDSIVLDIAAYDDARIVDDFFLDRLLVAKGSEISRPSFRRLRLVPGTAAANVETVPAAGTELATVARERAAKPYRYAYGVDVAETGAASPFGGLVKIDMDSRTAVRWSAPDAYAGEPIFVARPGGTDEDDGAVLSVVLDGRTGTSALVVLDARTLEERARAIAPHHIPFGFHGMFR